MTTIMNDELHLQTLCCNSLLYMLSLNVHCLLLLQLLISKRVFWWLTETVHSCYMQLWVLGVGGRTDIDSDGGRVWTRKWDSHLINSKTYVPFRKECEKYPTNTKTKWGKGFTMLLFNYVDVPHLFFLRKLFHFFKIDLYYSIVGDSEKTHPLGESAAEPKGTVKAQLSKMDLHLSL